MPNKKLKCKECGKYELREFMLMYPSGNFCTLGCATDWATRKGKAQRERQLKALEKKKAKAFRQETKQLREKAESLQDCVSKAQKAINKLITTYDNRFYGHCITGSGNVEDCGHYFHRGAKYRTSWLTLMHFNLHGQSRESNSFKGGEADKYKAGVINRYGQDYFESLKEFKRLEDRGEIPTPTKDEVRACAKWCRAMTKIYNR